ncbi:MAG: hypothetical protein U0V87_02035 [Acidobacteriota bacterium]
MIRRFAVLCFAVLALIGAPRSSAQSVPAADPCAGKRLVTKVVPIRFRAVNDAAEIAASLLGPCGEYRAPKSVRAITIIDESQYVQRVIEAISGWDVPPPTIELTVSLIIASREPKQSNPVIGDELRGVSEALAGLTQWTQYEMVSSRSIKLTEGGSAQLELSDGFGVHLVVAAVDVNAGIIKLDPLVLSRIPQSGEQTSATVRTPQQLLSLRTNLREGRQEIIMAPNREKDRALIVALKAWTDLGGSPLPVEKSPSQSEKD